MISPLHRFRFFPWLQTLRIYLIGTILVWTGLILASVTWNVYQHQMALQENARIMARTAFQKDVLYRRWNTGHGGIYVPVTETTQPNPYLNGYPGQVITTTSRKTYTLINPAYMTRQVFELQRDQMGILGHITSLKPIRPQNVADAWESQALQSFENGAKEASTVAVINGNAYLRLMQPLMVEERCLQCHARQGYQVGQVRGGISESVPLAPLQVASQDFFFSIAYGHAILWLFGMGLIVVAQRRLQHSVNRQTEAEQRLVEASTHDALTGLFNRAVFEDAFQEIEKLKVNPISILVADVDGLKHVNDTHGHIAGDHLLQQVAQIFKSCFREADLVARTGGDEFVVLLMNTDEQQAQMILQRIQDHLKAYNAGNPSQVVAISLGIATTGPEMSLSKTLHLADERMYQDKIQHKKAVRMISSGSITQ